MRHLLLLALALTTACRSVRPAWSIEQSLDETRRTTTEGDIIGGAGKHGGFAWLGIPFATPPTGELRWKPPRPPAPRQAVLTATRFGRACAQPDNELTINEPEHGDALGAEDCLTLNVWAPPNAEGLPVMVWIHGGGNSIGSAAGYDLSNLATKQRVVAVTVQYRMGPLGWFRHPSLADAEDASGNYGTLDLIRALEWLKDNAKAFGGAPGNVTVFGESAGGANTYSLLLSPKAKGLFHRAIAQSPALARSTIVEGERFVEEGGHPNSSAEVLVRLLEKRGAAGRAEAKAKLAAMKPEEIARTLRGVSVEELMQLYSEGAPKTAGMLDQPALFPDGVVLPEATWLESFSREGGWNRLPVITGSNRDEARLFQFLDPKWTWKLFGVLPRIRDEERYLKTASAVSRLWRAWSVDSIATAMRASGATDVWSYRFDWDDEPTILGSDLSKLVGAAHGLEISFVHGNFDGQLAIVYGRGPNPSRDALSNKMMEHWAAFARDGRPLPDWAPYDVSSDEAPRYLTFDAPAQTVKMTAGVERPEVLIEALLADPSTAIEEKCEGLTRLQRIGFVTAERVAKVTECAGKASGAGAK